MTVEVKYVTVGSVVFYPAFRLGEKEPALRLLITDDTLNFRSLPSVFTVQYREDNEKDEKKKDEQEGNIEKRHQYQSTLLKPELFVASLTVVIRSAATLSGDVVPPDLFPDL